MISKKQIEVFENIRSVGSTNMLDIRKVVALSEGILDKADCIEIMHSYEKLMKKHGVTRQWIENQLNTQI